MEVVGTALLRKLGSLRSFLTGNSLLVELVVVEFFLVVWNRFSRFRDQSKFKLVEVLAAEIKFMRLGFASRC